MAAIIRRVGSPAVQLSNVMKKCARRGHVSSIAELYKFNPNGDHPFTLMVCLNIHQKEVMFQPPQCLFHIVDLCTVNGMITILHYTYATTRGTYA